MVKLSGCDSIKQGLLKATSDSVRLASCLSLSANDSMRLGLLNIGQAYQGGILVYFLQSVDPGYDKNIKHGLIVALTDQGVVTWSNLSNTITGATGTAIGTGLSNTNKIISILGGDSKTYAAGLARTYRGGDYTDWYLPSRDELNKLWNYKNAGGGGTNFASEYWSSTENDGSNAYFSMFNPGPIPNFSKSLTHYVRAIRAF